MKKRTVKGRPVRSYGSRARKPLPKAQKKWPYYYPSGSRVPFNIRMAYFKELKAGKTHAPRGAATPPRVRRETMARRRKSRTRRFTKAARKSYRRGGGTFDLKKLLVPIGLATVAEPIVDRYAAMLPIPQIGGLQADDMAKVAIGWYLGKKGGVMGNTAKMLGIFGLRNLISQGLGTVLSGQTVQDPFAAGQGFG